MTLADLMCGPQESSQLLVISAKLNKHVLRGNEFFVVVFQALVFRNVADRTERRPADLPRSFRDVVGHGEDLPGVLIKEQVIISKVNSSNVPMEILCLQVKCENIGEQFAKRV